MCVNTDNGLVSGEFVSIQPTVCVSIPIYNLDYIFTWGWWVVVRFVWILWCCDVDGLLVLGY